ncbi:hypothetical protein [Salimicrobium halophilum]|uniref:Uncharacterized protein YpmB n=1 Tax=Salimicrobium halophilum TaxID=86666 RepID=A0A1G8Q2L7_9BACI|nr:hypothetical protein [Salimicrobium halophilum]SDI98695.1 Uncharacterized protein YpmB [Salimicrobium halophilum]
MRANYLWWAAGILSGVLLLGLILYVISYQVLDDRRTEGIQESIDFLEEEAGDIQITDSFSFTGNIPVHILYTSSGEEEKVYYINKNEKAIVDTMDTENQVSEETVTESWRANCGSCTFSGIQPAYKNEQPLWEITFTDGEGRYGLSYYHAETGEQYQRFAFKKNE